jgi:hypothetical protein
MDVNSNSLLTDGYVQGRQCVGSVWTISKHLMLLGNF